MTRFVSLFLLVLTLFGCQRAEKKHGPLKIGLCVVATGGYDFYAKEMLESARKYFFTEHDVKYFIFSDAEFSPVEDQVVTYQEHQPWPDVTLKRFHVYAKNDALFSDRDYVFAIDADMHFVAPIGEEILGKTVAVVRDVGKHTTYERKKRSKAYVKKKQARHYFAGAFYGGEKKTFLRMVHTLKRHVDDDLKWGYIAAWHDESHLNRYFFDHPPAKCLDMAYCYFENWELPYTPKIIALDKSLRK